jgi:hypothetical protein
MNAKLIRKVLTLKHREFVASIKDKRVQTLVDKHGFITGGSIVAMLLNEPVKDFDYYFDDLETTASVAQYYADLYKKQHGIDKDVNPKVVVLPPHESDPDGPSRVTLNLRPDGIIGENPSSDESETYTGQLDAAIVDADVKREEETASEQSPLGKLTDKIDQLIGNLPAPKPVKEAYRPIFFSPNAITLANKIQLVLRFYGNPAEIHKNYDFISCTCVWEPGHKTNDYGQLTLPALALESILTKQLRYVGSLYPLCSIFRTRKFIQRGWYINAGDLLKMAFQVSELDLTNIDVLEEQLTGVDAAYFIQVIGYCRKRQQKDPSFQITLPYLVTILDKIFY